MIRSDDNKGGDGSLPVSKHPWDEESLGRVLDDVRALHQEKKDDKSDTTTSKRRSFLTTWIKKVVKTITRH